jgi:CRP/FNR family cyclic AMP-dependent transcriptional regulator
MKRSRFQHLLDNSIPFNRFLLILNDGQFIGMIEHERLLNTDARLARAWRSSAALAAARSPFAGIASIRA